MALVLLVLGLAWSGLAAADIYKCETDGQVVYQSKPCPQNVDSAQDMSHLDRGDAPRDYAPQPKTYRQKYLERSYKDYRADRRASALDYKERRYLRERKRLRRERLSRQRAAQRRADRARRDRLRRERQRDREFWRDSDRRKARRNGDYLFIDVD